MIRAHWFQISYRGRAGKRVEVVVYTGESLPAVMERIAAAQRGRLAYDPHGPRITRIAAIQAPPLDRAFARMLDEVLMFENTRDIRTV